MTNEGKLLNFQKSTMEAARKKSTNLLDEYVKSLNQDFEEYKAERKNQAELQIKTERQNLLRQKNKELSGEQIHNKQKLIQKHAQLKELLFTEVRDLLSQFRNSSDYDDLLIQQIRKDVTFARGQNMIIYIDPEDESKLKSLEAATGVSLTVSKYSFMGGTRAVIPDQNILIDDSFEAKLEEAYENFTFKGGHSHA